MIALNIDLPKKKKLATANTHTTCQLPYPGVISTYFRNKNPYIREPSLFVIAPANQTYFRRAKKHARDHSQLQQPPQFLVQFNFFFFFFPLLFFWLSVVHLALCTSDEILLYILNNSSLYKF